MIKKIKKYFSAFIVATVVFSSVPMPAFAAAEVGGQLMFILDASSSMLATDGTSTTRIQKARQSLSSSLDSIPAEVSVGLRAYGHTVGEEDQANGCKDTALLNAPTTGNIAQIKDSVANIQARGWTPIGASLQAVENDFKGESNRSVILISDGIDTCGAPDPCDVAKDLASRGLNIKINTLGLVVDNAARAQLQCISGATGGNYFDVSDINRLNDVVGAVTQREANLFGANGIPVQGEPRYEDAPLLLPNTPYTDSITDTEELYYGIELLPEQSFTFTVRTEPVGRGIYRAGTAISTNWYDAETGERVGGARSTPVAIVNGIGSETVVFEDTVPKDIDETKKYVMRVDFKARGVTTPQPYELSYTTEGGILPENESIDEVGSSNDESNNGSGVPVYVWPIIIVLLLAAGAATYFVIKRKGKAKAAQTPNDPTPPTDTTPQV